MSKKEKRISINTFEKIAAEQFPEIVKEQWCDIEVTIKRSLSLRDMMAFVDEIADACFMTDGSFIPEIMDFVIKAGILTRYANFTLPNNLEKQYWLVYSTDAAEMVARHINSVQLQEIVNAANRKIEHMRNTDIIATREKLNELYASFAKMGEHFSEMFDGVSADDVQKAMHTLGGSGLSEEKIVSAYIEHMKKNTGE